MKKVIGLLILIGILGGCSDDDSYFGEAISKESLSFTPLAGGAVMHYRLPKHTDVMGIRVRYQNAYGEEELRTGSYACDTLVLSGFTEARTGVLARVALCDRAGNESAPVEVMFDTKDSGPILFFNKLEITPSWQGFTMSYSVEEKADGMAHVFYVGKNPNTQETDTLLLSSFYFTQGIDTLSYKLQQEYDANTVVVRTEDIQSGHTVKQGVYENIKSYNMEMLPASEYDFLDPEELSIEDDASLLSKDYLFDGDTRGETSYGLGITSFGTYLAGPMAFDKPLFIIDLKEPKHLAEVRLYTILNLDRWYHGIFGGTYEEKLPCNVTVFASNSKDDESSWVELGHFEQDKALDPSLRWCEKVPSVYYSERLKTPEEIRRATPYYMLIQFPINAEAYRYLKLVATETFYSCFGNRHSNLEQYVTFHEFEVYTKKD